MKKISTLIVSLAAILGMGAAMFASTPVMAAIDCDVDPVKAAGAAKVAACSACAADAAATAFDPATGKCTTKSGGDLNNTIHTVINIMLFIVGILAVIMLIYGGIRYIISRGKQEEIKGAKDTILYSIVGLIVAILAFAIVQWVFGSLQ